MTTTETVPHLLTIDQLAEHLGITTRHVRRLVAERRIPYVKDGWLERSRRDDQPGVRSSTWTRRTPA